MRCWFVARRNGFRRLNETKCMRDLQSEFGLAVTDAAEAVKISKEIAIDCVVVDCENDGIPVTRGIARARPGIPILFVSDQLEGQVQVYSEAVCS